MSELARGEIREECGYVDKLASRLLVFPNTNQYRASTFALIGKSKPGQRKILVFFLVDPTQSISRLKTNVGLITTSQFQAFGTPH